MKLWRADVPKLLVLMANARNAQDALCKYLRLRGYETKEAQAKLRGRIRSGWRPVKSRK